MHTKKDTRERIVATASTLFQTQGFHGTGLNEIIQKSGAPKGSLYYYFPDGKEALGIAAISFAKKSIEEKIQRGLQRADDPASAMEEVIGEIVDALNQNGKLENTSLGLVALETYLSSESLRNACSESFGALEEIYAEKLMDAGMPKEVAKELGMAIQAIMEGSILLSVTHQDTAPLITAAKQIRILIEHYS